MNIIFERGLRKENATILCKWSNDRGDAFQEQWMGLKISYPLTYDKIKEMENVFSIFNEDEFLGIIQQIRVEKDNIHIGRIIINPKKQGMGFGKEAIRGFIDLIFKDESIKSISLNVFDSNKNARNIYTKLGFEIDEVIETPKLKYLMKKYRQ